MTKEEKLDEMARLYSNDISFIEDKNISGDSSLRKKIQKIKESRITNCDKCKNNGKGYCYYSEHRDEINDGNCENYMPKHWWNNSILETISWILLIVFCGLGNILKKVNNDK